MEQAHEVVRAGSRRLRDLNGELRVLVEPAAVVVRLRAVEARLGAVRTRARGRRHAGRDEAWVRGGLDRVAGTLGQELRELRVEFLECRRWPGRRLELL